MFKVSILMIAALCFGLMGLVALVAPGRVSRQFGIDHLDVDGRNEIRAVYGGFGLAVAGGLVFALREPQWRAPAASAVALALAGMAVGRAVSAIIDRRIGGLPALYGCMEAIGAAALAATV